ncbi:hypothetical protein OIO90_002346 [Microbotryomycetes sp. JL221]|nr:hypothetical protein OIO90_002346 [Microbotryomycetes sp. JL221]
MGKRVYRGKWGISGPQPTFSRPDIPICTSSTHGTRVMGTIKKPLKPGQRVNRQDAFPQDEQGHKLVHKIQRSGQSTDVDDNDEEQEHENSTKRRRTTSKRAKQTRVTAAMERQQRHLFSLDHEDDAESSGNWSSEFDYDDEPDSEDLDADTPHEQRKKERQNERRDHLQQQARVVNRAEENRRELARQAAERRAIKQDASITSFGLTVTNQDERSSAIQVTQPNRRPRQRSESSVDSRIILDAQNDPFPDSMLNEFELEIKSKLTREQFNTYMTSITSAITESSSVRKRPKALAQVQHKRQSEIERDKKRANTKKANHDKEVPSEDNTQKGKRRTNVKMTKRKAKTVPVLMPDEEAQLGELEFSSNDELSVNPLPRRSASSSAPTASIGAQDELQELDSELGLNIQEVFKLYKVIDPRKDKQRQLDREQLSDPPTDCFSSDESEIFIHDDEILKKEQKELKEFEKEYKEAKKRKKLFKVERRPGYSNPRRN